MIRITLQPDISVRPAVSSQLTFDSCYALRFLLSRPARPLFFAMLLAAAAAAAFSANPHLLGESSATSRCGLDIIHSSSLRWSWHGTSSAPSPAGVSSPAEGHAVLEQSNIIPYSNQETSCVVL